MAGSATLSYGAFDLERRHGSYRTDDDRFAIRQRGAYDWRILAEDVRDEAWLEREAPAVFTTLTAAAGWLDDHYPDPPGGAR